MIRIDEMPNSRALGIVLELAERGGYIEAKDAADEAAQEAAQEAYATQQAAIFKVMMLRDQFATEVENKPVSEILTTSTVEAE